MSPDTFAQAWFLTGPTASGKSAVGLALARQIGAEIISMDSMTLYRGMDIGTAKLTASERSEIHHHLVDVLEPHQNFSVAQYLNAAAEAIQQIASRERQVLFVGGTPLYLKALLRGLFQGPPADWELRQQLDAEMHEGGESLLHNKLSQVDPRSAARLHAHDKRRVIRALEVYYKTGRPLSDWQQEFDRARPAVECRVFVLDWPRTELHSRIDRRVDQMFDAGLVEEVRALTAGSRRFGRTASQALGYREVLEHLTGQRDLLETIELVKTRTRQFAKRQLTWFRSLSECRIMAVQGLLEPIEIARRIAELGQSVVCPREG